MLEFDWKCVSLLVIVFCALLKYYQQCTKFFEKRNVKTPKTAPILGYLYEILVKQRHVKDVFQDFYNEFADTRSVKDGNHCRSVSSNHKFPDFLELLSS